QVARSALEHGFERLGRVGRALELATTQLADPQEQRHLALDVAGRHGAQLSLERGHQVRPASLGLEHTDESSLGLDVAWLDGKGALPGGDRGARIAEALLVELGGGPMELDPLRLRWHQL